MTQPTPASTGSHRRQSAVAERLAEIVGRAARAESPERAAGLQLRRTARLSAPAAGSRFSRERATRRSRSCDCSLRRDLPFVPRGAGTGLSGGALADDIVVIGLHRLKQIISLDVENRRATVEPAS